jgi:hypothetical protein
MDRGAAGSKGGRTTFERYGSAHMAKIGKRWFETTVARHWQRARAAYRDYLGLRRREQQMESFVDSELAIRVADGEQVACVEIPVLSGPDDDVPF